MSIPAQTLILNNQILRTIGAHAERKGRSRITFVRRLKSDPRFPNPDYITEGGWKYWTDSSIDGYEQRKLEAARNPKQRVKRAASAA
jgi:hypothetical protein